jgi:hypothetical protein
MAFAYEYMSTSRVVKDETTGATISAVNPTVHRARMLLPNKVYGSFITLPGGDKFRRATTYWRYRFDVQPQSPQLWRGRDTAAPFHSVSVTTNGGGQAAAYAFIAYDNLGCFTSKLGCFNNSYTPTIPQGMWNEAVTKALLKIADQKVNLAENLATLGQTIRLFTGTASTLADLLKSAYRDKALRPWLTKSYRAAKQDGIPKVIAERYLEYVYGWKPLMEDLYSLYKLSQTGFGKSLVLHAQGHAKQRGSSGSRTVTYTSLAARSTMDYVDEKSRVNCHLWARLDPNWQGARAFNQLGLLNPVSLAWELMPWSFVVDWMLPIGSVLQALSAPAGLIFINGSVAMRCSASGPYSHEYYGAESGRTWSYKTPATGSCSYEGYSRQELTSWPLPGIWTDPDPLRGDRGFKALALALANLGGMRLTTIR